MKLVSHIRLSFMIASSMKNLDKDVIDDTADKTTENKENSTDDKMEETTPPPTVLSEKRKVLFEPLEPIMDLNGRAASSAETLLPPPDFDSASYPRGWLIGKKRKLVNVDVVESMRKIAVQEMNRKDREIDGLNEQLEEDSCVLENLQVQLLDERSKRADVERPNAMLQNQVLMQQVPNQHLEAAILHHKCYYLNHSTLLTQLCCKSGIFSLMRS